MVNSKDFAERLQTVMDHYALNASSFADRIGVQRSGISHILAGRNKPSLDFVLKIIKKFEAVDLYWLLIGKGSFPPAETTAPDLNPAPEQTSAETAGKKPEERINLVPKTTMASKTGESNNRDIAKIIVLYKNGNFDSFEN